MRRANPHGRFATERLPVKMDAGPAELEEIWRDPVRLRVWTWDMLRFFDDGASFPCEEALARVVEDDQREWLRRLKYRGPLHFARELRRVAAINARGVPYWTEVFVEYWTKLAANPRRRGERRRKLGLREAWELKNFIQEKWWQVFGHWTRHDNLAYEMAAAAINVNFTAERRITVEQMQEYSRDRSRHRRSKKI